MERRPIYHRRRGAPGASPGVLEAAVDAHPTRLRAMVYDRHRLEEVDPPDVRSARDLLTPERVLWLDCEGLADGGVFEDLHREFGLSRLALEDVVHVGQRPKAEEHGDELFCVARMLRVSKADNGKLHFDFEQLGMFLGRGFVLTFQERPGDCFDALRERLRKGRPTLRTSGPDYLAVMVLDAVVDAYFPALELVGEYLEELERRVLERPDDEVLAEIYSIKREFLAFRRAAWPLRDALNHLLRDPHALLESSVRPYLRDAADHVTQIVEVLETYRELAGSFVDVYLSSVSQRTNEVMRVLTVVTTIFIPLSFLAGVYGMNFERIPELHWDDGYAYFWGLVLVVAAGLLVLFRRLGRLGGRTP